MCNFPLTLRRSLSQKKRREESVAEGCKLGPLQQDMQTIWDKWLKHPLTPLQSSPTSPMDGKPSTGGPAMIISLRRFELWDADVAWEWMGDEQVGRYTSWDAFATREAAVDYFRASVLPHPWYRAVCLDGRPAGFVAAKPAESAMDRCRAEVSYGLARRFWGRGVVTAAVKMAAAELFEEWPHLERLEGLAALENVASQRVLEKAGFRREGLLRSYRFTKGKLWDMVCYSLTRADCKV